MNKLITQNAFKKLGFISGTDQRDYFFSVQKEIKEAIVQKRSSVKISLEKSIKSKFKHI
jgi:hypothetical protein